jgi:hypothetical protein
MITIEEIAKEMGIDFSLETQDEGVYFREVAELAINLSSAGETTLRACHTHGPLEDGDVPSKSGRDDLLNNGFVAKVVVRGEQGYNACTYKGHLALRVLNAKIKLNALESLDMIMSGIEKPTTTLDFKRS